MQNNKFLIIKIAAIGDTCMATPLAKNLKTAFPDARIDWLVHHWSLSILQHNSNIDNVILFTPPSHLKNKITAYLAVIGLIIKLRRVKYDIAIIPHRSKFAGMLANLAGIKRFIGFDFKNSSRYLTTGAPFNESLHEVDRNLLLLEVLKIPVKSNDMEMYLSEDEMPWVNNFLLTSGLDKNKKIVIISPGGGDNPGLSMHIKRWGKEKFIELSNNLKKQFNVILIGNNSDLGLCNEVSSKSDAINICGKTNLRQLAAVISKSHLYIGNDSGPLYMAASINIPTIGIYGPSDPRLVAPQGEKHKYLWSNVDCSPCYHPMSVYDTDFSVCKENHKCMKSISVESVIHLVEKQFGATTHE